MALLEKDHFTDILSQSIESIAQEHDKNYIEWMPHDWVPWDQGENFAYLGGVDYSPEQSTLPEDIRAATVLLLLHNDQLPSYHRILTQKAPTGTRLFLWINRWTAEKAGHSAALRDYIVVTRNADPDELETRRLKFLMKGYLQNSSTWSLNSLESIILVGFTEAITAELAAQLSEKTDDVSLKNLTLNMARDCRLHTDAFRKMIAYVMENGDKDAISDLVRHFAASACPIGEDWGEGFPEVDTVAKEIYTPEKHQKVINDFVSSLNISLV